MQNFIFENSTKVFFGKGCVKEFLASLVGGSVMDCCKAVSLAAVYKGDIWNDFWAKPGVIDFDPLPLGVVVTVAGTGSECNGGAVITNEELKVKTGRDYPRCNARFALMDPTYTFTVPKAQMISGGFDTLSHIMEIYFSGPDEENVSDDLAEALMRGTIRDLRAAVKNPEDYHARSNLMWEATMAENRILKLNKRTDFQRHMMEHQLAAYVNCSHGSGLAVLHPAYYRAICEKGAAKFARFATRVWDTPAEGKSEKALARAGRGCRPCASWARTWPGSSSAGRPARRPGSPSLNRKRSTTPILSASKQCAPVRRFSTRQ